MPASQNSYDSGQSFSTVSIPNVNGVYMYAHAYSNSAGGPNNDNRHAYIFQIQAWGVNNPYIDGGLHIREAGTTIPVGAQLYSGSPTTKVNNLKFQNAGLTYQVPFLTTQSVTLLPSFNGYGYQWGMVAWLAPASAGSIGLYTSNGILMAMDNGLGGWNSAPGFTVTGSINAYGSGSNGGYTQGLVLVNVTPSQGTAPYIQYTDPQAGPMKIQYNNSAYFLPDLNTNLSVNLMQLPTTTHVYSGGTSGPGGYSIDGDFVNTYYGADSPNEIDIYSEHYFARSYTLTNINFRVYMAYYAYGNNVDTGNFNAEIYYTTNGGSSWTQWWGTSG